MTDQAPRPGAFPAPVYARHVLEPAFYATQAALFEPMMQANKAHTVMLIECGIIEPQSGGRLLAAIARADAEGSDGYSYDPQVEDLSFAVEKRIIEIAGDEAGGNLQLARSRNDLDAVMCRLALRGRLQDIMHATLGLRGRLMALAEEHINTLMPGVTHTQEAQPTTLAHYLLGVLGPLGRDGEHLMHSYDQTNSSPLGAAAFTTTSLPIDRERTAELLAFIDVVENGYDAVGGADYILQAVGALRILALSLARFVNDLLIWARTDTGIVRIGNEFIQISSLMPQKRNPVVLEHVRARIGYVIGDATTVEALVHNAAFGNTVDTEDAIHLPLFRCCEHTLMVLDVLASVLDTIQFDTNRLARQTGSGFGVSTELAECLVREFGLPFRQAHTIVTRVVRELTLAGEDMRSLTIDRVETIVEDVTGRRVGLNDELLAECVDPAGFVARRTAPGGPAPLAIRAALEREHAISQNQRDWLEAQQTVLFAAAEHLDALVSEMATVDRR